MFHLELSREDGERVLRALKLPVTPQSATERYNREQHEKERLGPLFA